VRFSGTFGGENRPSVTAAPVAVLPRLAQAVADPRNWSGPLPAGVRPLCTFRERPMPGAIRVHPLATLTLRQRVVPLRLSISRFGHAKPAGPHRFDITGVQVDGRDVTAEPIRDHFAPAQFLEMTDDEKLARPSFEMFQAGVAVGRDALAVGPGVDVPLSYKTTVLDPRQDRIEVAPQPMPAGAAAAAAGFGAAARSRLGRTGRSKYKNAGQPISIAEPAYVVSTIDSDQPRAVAGPNAPARLAYAEALEAMQSHASASPDDRGRLQVRVARAEDAA
jgi:hypothetical protein